MKKRDLWVVIVAFVALGFAGGAVFLLRNFKLTRIQPAHDAGSAELTPLPPLEPDPDEDAGPEPDAGPAPSPSPSERPPPGPGPAPRPDAASRGADSGASTVLHAQNLVIHSTGHPKMCIDYSPQKHVLNLYPCHGRVNQRWNAAEDVGASIRLSGKHGCFVVAGTTEDGVPGLTLAECTAGASKFRHFEAHRLEETLTGKCVTARRFDKGTPLSLEACDPGNAGQSWTLSAD